MDWESKTVTGFLGDLAIIGVSQTYISLRGRGKDSDLVGFIRRSSGGAILASPKRDYELPNENPNPVPWAVTRAISTRC